MTVTGSLDITSGSDHITVSDIDKGMGKIGQNQGDGMLQRFANESSGLDKFVMGRESDDWSLGGKEIIGSNNGGDSFKLGNDLPPGRVTPPSYDNWANQIQSLVNYLTGNKSGNQNENEFHPYRKPVDRNDSTQETNDVMANIRNNLRNLSRAVKRLSRLADMSNTMNNFRNRGFYA